MNQSKMGFETSNPKELSPINVSEKTNSQFDQKNAFNQFNEQKDINSKSSINSENQAIKKNSLPYKGHSQDQTPSDDLFASEYKTRKNDLTQYESPSICDFLERKTSSSNKDCSQSKKTLFHLNQQSSQKDSQQFNSSDFNQNLKISEFNESQNQNSDYLPCKDNRRSDHSNPQQNTQTKSKIPMSTHNTPIISQKSEHITRSGSNNNKMESKKLQIPSQTDSFPQNYPYYSNNQNMISQTSSPAHKLKYIQNQRGQSRNSMYHQNRNSVSSNYNNHNNKQNNNNSNTVNEYPNYPHYNQQSGIYPSNGSHQNRSEHPQMTHPSHHNLHHYYQEDDMDYYEYNEMYPSYYYPPYMHAPSEHFHSKNTEEDLAENANESEEPNEEYRKYYYGYGPSAYGYYPVSHSSADTVIEQQNNQAQIHSNGKQRDTTTTGIVSETENLSVPPTNHFAQRQEKYGRPPYMRGYYDPKGYYPPPPHCYYYPPLGDIQKGGNQEGNKNTSRKSINQAGQVRNLNMNQQSYPNSDDLVQSHNNPKQDQEADIYGYPMDSSYHAPYSKNHPNQSSSSAIYCDASYYIQDQQHQRSSKINFKRPHYSTLQNKENIMNKSNTQYKENQKVVRQSGIIDKSQSSLVAGQNKKEQKQVLQQLSQNKKINNEEQYQMDDQESSYQNGQSASHEIRKRKRKNNDQLKILKVEYQKGGFWGKEKILEVSQITGLSESQVYKWCWDQKKKRLETFKRKLGNNLLNGPTDQSFEEMSGEPLEEESYQHFGSPEKMQKLNDETSIVPIKANISKLNNDFTINQLQQKVLANKGRTLQNITDKVLSRQNSKLDNQNQNLKTNLSQQQELSKLNSNDSQNDEIILSRQDQENINPDN